MLKVHVNCRQLKKHNGPRAFVSILWSQSLQPANEVWGKVMFLHLCVILFTGGGVSLTETPTRQKTSWTAIPWIETPLDRDTPLDKDTPFPRQRPPRMVKSGRYASYWNAFLFHVVSCSEITSVHCEPLSLKKASALWNFYCSRVNVSILCFSGYVYESLQFKESKMVLLIIYYGYI